MFLVRPKASEKNTRGPGEAPGCLVLYCTTLNDVEELRVHIPLGLVKQEGRHYSGLQYLKNAFEIRFYIGKLSLS